MDSYNYLYDLRPLAKLLAEHELTPDEAVSIVINGKDPIVIAATRLRPSASESQTPLNGD